jgi:hypothetical protein
MRSDTPGDRIAVLPNMVCLNASEPTGNARSPERGSSPCSATIRNLLQCARRIVIWALSIFDRMNPAMRTR